MMKTDRTGVAISCKIASHVPSTLGGRGLDSLEQTILHDNFARRILIIKAIWYFLLVEI